MKVAALVILALLAGCAKAPPTTECALSADTKRDPSTSPLAVSGPCPELKVEGGGVNVGDGPATVIVTQPNGDQSLK